MLALKCERVSSPNLRKVLGILTDTADTDICFVSFGISSVAVPLVFIHLSYDFESIRYSLPKDLNINIIS